jgi:peptidyl-prolyl cis-trans isomerase D
MLGVMRKYKQSIVIKIVFGVIVLSFIGTIFLVWGKGDDVSTGGYAAKVNGNKITLDDYQKSYYRIRNIYEQIYGKSLTPEMEKQIGLKKMAMDSLIDAVLVRQESKKLGIKVSKDDISNEIAKIPSFQKDGAFNFDLYVQTLKANRITPQSFEDSQEADLIVKKTRDKIKDRVMLTDQDLLQAFKKQNDKVELQFASWSPADVKGEVTLSEQELTTYLQGHQEEFKTQEMISISYVLLDPSAQATKVAVSDEEVQAYYQKNIDRYQGKGGILPFAEVKDRAKVDAAKLKAIKEMYEKAADTVNKNLKTGDLNAAAAAVGGKIVDTPLFTAKAPAAAIAGESELIKKAFSVKQGELGGPVETPKGIYILKVKDRKPAVVPPLAEIKQQVSLKATEAKARDLAKKKAEEALVQLAKGGSALKLQDSGSFGYSAAGVIPRIGTSPEMMEAAFELTTAAAAAKTPFKIGDRWFAVKLKQRIEANSADFQKNKEQIKQSILPKKQQEALDTWLKELKAKSKIEINSSIIAD